MANFNGKFAITAIVAAGIAALVLWQENSIARTRTNNDALTTRLAELERTRPDAPSSPSPADLAAAAARDRAELERLRGQAALLGPRLQEARAAREDAAKAAAAAGADRPAHGPVEHPPGYISLLSAQDAGTATGEALFQTFAWALRNGNTNRMLQVLDFSTDEGRAEAEQMLRDLPTLVTNEDFQNHMEDTGFRVIRQVPLENGDAALVLQTFDNPDSSSREAMRIRRVGNEWRIVIGKHGPEEVKLPKEQLSD